MAALDCTGEPGEDAKGLLGSSIVVAEHEAVDVDRHRKRHRRQSGQIALGSYGDREIGGMNAGHLVTEPPIDLLHQPFGLRSHLLEPRPPTVGTGTGRPAAAAAGGLPPQP